MALRRGGKYDPGRFVCGAHDPCAVLRRLTRRDDDRVLDVVHIRADATVQAQAAGRSHTFGN